MKKLVLLCLLFASMEYTFAQGIQTPVASPRQAVTQEFGLGEIRLSYSRPATKDRVIFGDLVPFDKVWRTGANSPTTLEFTQEVIIGDKKIAPGKYGLVTIPGKTSWKIIITSQTDINSPALYKPENNIVEINAPVVALNSKVESFSIAFDNITNNSAELIISWDKTAVKLPIRNDIDGKIMAQINEVMNSDSDKKPYFQAAMYYLENGKDLKKAHEWINAAVKETPDFFWIQHNKAKIEAALGMKDAARASALKSIELAKAAKNDDYVKLNQDLLKSL